MAVAAIANPKTARVRCIRAHREGTPALQKFLSSGSLLCHRLNIFLLIDENQKDPSFLDSPLHVLLSNPLTIQNLIDQIDARARVEDEGIGSTARVCVTERSVKMSSGTLAGGNFEDFERDLEALLREQQHVPSGRIALDRERDTNIYRSGSAPPTVEGSRATAGGLFGPVGPSRTHSPGGAGEEDMLSHQAYLSHYYSSGNLNPRLPPPALSREEWRVMQRLRTGAHSLSGIGDNRSGSSLFTVQPGLPARNGERDLVEPGRLRQLSLSRPPHSTEWFEQGTDRQGAQSYADTLQVDFGKCASISGNISRPVSCDSFDSVIDSAGVSDVQLTQLNNDIKNVDAIYSGSTSNGLIRVQSPSLGSMMSHSFASVLGSSMARSSTPDPQLIRRSTSPCLPPVGARVFDTDKKILSNGFGSVSSCMTDSDDLANTLTSLKLSDTILEDGQNHPQGQLQQNFANHPDLLFSMTSDQSQYIHQNITNKAQNGSSDSTVPLRVYSDFSRNTGILKDAGLSTSISNGHTNFSKRLSSTDIYKKVPVGSTSLTRSSGHYQTDIDFDGYNSTYSPNQGLPTMLNNQLGAGFGEGQYLNRVGNQVGSSFQVSISDPLYGQYLQRASDSDAQSPLSLSDPSLGRNFLDTSIMDLTGSHGKYPGALLAQQNLHYGTPFLGKSGAFNNGFYGNHSFGLGMPYPSQLSGSVLSSLGPGSSFRQSDRMSHVPSIARSATGGSRGSWNHENGLIKEGFALSLLEELKNNKTRSFELSEIVGHVVEFSADQYGSRFIQQKLESASVEEKNIIFPEILPHARVLMTDVFGNYVIQKFFEHGTECQRNQLAGELLGYVLPLSLQMYGCRVIQKALEVVDVDQQTKMVLELEGSIMKCVRDQNGNHVIQKCIECVPQERIQFVVSSFYGQVVALSTHPYGCRVIQRVLEHCDDAQTQRIMMEEILQSVCTLAQDQYGNYVVQHVLQHGNQEERSAIIRMLSGQIVKMSQQKFASNVIEKCLTYGTSEERQLLIDEMLGTTEENEPLQAMMKDQFGNYVVQKVLETCDDQNRELIVSRIKIYLGTLKKFTYGKHIVTRVEKLIATGERHIGMSANST